MSRRLTVWAADAFPEIVAGDNLPAMIVAALEGDLEHGDIVVVTSKIVSKAEGRSIAAADREHAITSQTVRVVASRAHPGGVTRIVENPLGLVMAAAGVDSSNTPDGTVLLLPEDPDASAAAIAGALRTASGVDVGVIITDTVGRPWREGQTDIGIGAAGVWVIDDYRGQEDTHGRTMNVSAAAVIDEIAAATDLVKGKTSGCPVAVVRGLPHLVGGLDLPGARHLVRPADRDMFRLGSDEAWAEGFAAGRGAGDDSQSKNPRV